MFCLSNLSIVAQANLSEGDSSSSSSSPLRNGNDPKSPIRSPKSIALPKRKRNPSPPNPTVIQIERIVGAGSFRDGQPADSDMRKSVFDLFLGQKYEGPVEKKLRETGEWIINNTEEDFRTSGTNAVSWKFKKQTTVALVKPSITVWSTQCVRCNELLMVDKILGLMFLHLFLFGMTINLLFM